MTTNEVRLMKLDLEKLAKDLAEYFNTTFYFKPKEECDENTATFSLNIKTHYSFFHRESLKSGSLYSPCVKVGKYNQLHYIGRSEWYDLYTSGVHSDTCDHLLKVDIYTDKLPDDINQDRAMLILHMAINIFRDCNDTTCTGTLAEVGFSDAKKFVSDEYPHLAITELVKGSNGNYFAIALDKKHYDDVKGACPAYLGKYITHYCKYRQVNVIYSGMDSDYGYLMFYLTGKDTVKTYLELGKEILDIIFSWEFKKLELKRLGFERDNFRNNLKMDCFKDNYLYSDTIHELTFLDVNPTIFSEFNGKKEYKANVTDKEGVQYEHPNTDNHVRLASDRHSSLHNEEDNK